MQHTTQSKLKISLANTGKKRSEETKLKMRLRKLGKKQSSEHVSKRVNQLKGDKNFFWKGDKVGYRGIHQWIVRNYGQPTTCEHCQNTNLFGKNIHWANISHEYKRDRLDWLRLCAKCHGLFDKGRRR